MMAADSLEHEVQRMLELLDSLDMNSVGGMLADDAQSVDENTRGWTRGRAAIEEYLSELEPSASDVHSQMRDVEEVMWGDVGLVTFVLEQTYKMDGQAVRISAPTSIVFRRQNGEWKVALIHTVPIPEEG
jgi:ketosteroid isomerase-like protein